MMFKNKLALAILAAGISTQAAAAEIGEFNGTKLSIGGYVKAEGVYDMPENGSDDFAGSMRQTRLNVSAVKQVDGHTLKAFVEGDFWDNNIGADFADGTYGLRLRHAYVAVDNVTVGQTWNGQFFANAPFDVEMVNFWGLGVGTIAGNGAVIRPDLVAHYTLGGLRLTLQDPVQEGSAYPDMVAAYTYRTGGHAFNAAITGREVQDTGNNGDDTEFGAALSLAAKFQFADTTLAVSGFTGEGAGVYAGWGYNGGAAGPNISDVDGAGDLIKTTGMTAGITQKFSSNLRGTVRYGQVKADEVAATVEDDTLDMVNVNLIYTYMPGLDIGVEWRDQSATTRPTAFSADTSGRPEGQQVELFAMLKF